ncbi:hypothetical protein [Flagellimonas sp. 2504JD4-2]
MIDFSCCEVEKAVKSLFSDNEVLRVSAIIKSYGQTFADDGKTVYYGFFTNVGDGHQAMYGAYPLASDSVTLFSRVLNPRYDFFQGYEIRLKNNLDGSVDYQQLKLINDTEFGDDSVTFNINWTLFVGTYPLFRLTFSSGDYIILKTHVDGVQAYDFLGWPLDLGNYLGQSVRIECLNDDLSVRGMGENVDGGLIRVEHYDMEIKEGFNTVNLNAQPVFI